MITDSLGSHVFRSAHDGEWEGTLVPSDNTLYRLEVTLQDGEVLSAETRYPKRYHYSPERGHLYRKALFPDTGDIVDYVLWYDVGQCFLESCRAECSPDTSPAHLHENPF